MYNVILFINICIIYIYRQTVNMEYTTQSVGGPRSFPHKFSNSDLPGFHRKVK